MAGRRGGGPGVERPVGQRLPALRCTVGRPRSGVGEGSATHGYVEDQRWTLARVAELIARLFRQRYTPRGVSMLLHRIGFSPQIPKHRPVERDEAAIATWRREVWPQAK
jgi:transposase